MGEKAKNVRLLLADDDQDDRDFFVYAATRLSDKISVVTLNDGKLVVEYLSQLSENEPYMIFLDINMPRMSGLECLDFIKNSEKWKHIPVVMYSTSENDNDIQKSFASGANSYIVKPYSLSSLESIINKILLSDFSSRPSSLKSFVIKN